MIALDTNVLVRYLTDDDADQARRAGALLEGVAGGDERLFVSQVVLCELVWVLRGAYGRPKSDVLLALEGLISSAQLLVQDADLALRALDQYRRGKADFADYIIAESARAAGCSEVATFDHELLAEDGFVAPSP